MTTGTMTSLADLLRCRAKEQPEDVAYTFVPEDGGPARHLTYAALDQQASQLAARLSAVAGPGDRAVLLHPAGLDFLVAFFGCMYSGVVAVPVASPIPGRLPRTLTTLRGIVADCRPRAVLSTAAELAPARALFDSYPEYAELVWLETVADGGSSSWGRTGEGWAPAIRSEDDLVYLQYTSGSTRSPRGVMITNRNLMANLAAASYAAGRNVDGSSVFWLPHYHDMGLTGMLSSLYLGQQCTLMSPLAFMARPLDWLRLVSERRAVWTGAPNFALDWCVRRAAVEGVAGLDLSSLTWVGTGAEPVRADTLERFLRAFGPVGLPPDVLMPCYGLAESVLWVTGPMGRRPPPILTVDSTALSQSRAKPCAENGARTTRLVGVGSPSPGHQVVIVDPQSSRARDEDSIGEIWIGGPSVAEGYWNRPEDRASVFLARLADGRGPFLRTGDLGFLHQGELFVTGRLKDLIIIGGANHYPQDIERTAEEAHPAIRPGAVAAFSVDGPAERLVLLLEMAGEADAAEVHGALCAAVAEGHGVRVEGIGVLPPRHLPKTSSGKIRRHACREIWQSGDEQIIARWESPRSAVSAATAGSEAPGPEVHSSRQLEAEAALLARLRRVAGDAAATFDVLQPLTQLGLGSLELTEVRAQVEDEVGIRLSLRRLLQGCSVREVVREAIRELPDATPVRADSPYERTVNPALGGLLRRLRMDKRYVRADGCWLFDADGVRYLDAIAGYGAVPFGHNPPAVWQALRAVEVSGEPTFVQPSDLGAASELAERLVAIAPPGLTRVAFVNSGAEAAETAIKLARAATGRRRVLSTKNGFHGKTLGALSATGSAALQHPFFAPVPDFRTVPYGDLVELERVLAEEGHETAAFLVEPIQAEGGVVTPPAGYLEGARALCSRHGVLLVLDEVQTGLGRTGSLLACEADGVVPDILMLAKALGGGLLPLGAVVYADHAYSEQFALRHSSTFAGGALAARTGLAVLDLLERDGRALVAQVAENGARLRAGLEALARQHPAVLTDVRGRGFLLGLELASSRDTFGSFSLLGLMAEEGRLAALLASQLLAVEHVRVAPTLLSSHVLRIEPPLTFTPAMCDTVVDAVGRSLTHLSRGDTPALLNHLLERPRAVHSRPRAVAPRRAPTRPAPGCGRWAFLVHPLDGESYEYLDPGLAAFSRHEAVELAERWSDLVSPFVIASASIRSAAGASAYGEFIVVPRTAAQLHALRPEEAVPLVRDAIALARERGAEVVGLGGQISVVTGGGLDLGDAGVPLTTGNAFTAWNTLETLRTVTADCELELSSATAAVLGAAGSVGRAVSALLARHCRRVILLGNPAHPQSSMRSLRSTAESVVRWLLAEPSGAIGARAAELAGAGSPIAAVTARMVEEGWLVLGVDADALLPAADCVVTATSATEAFVLSRHLKPGAIVCDTARPLNVPTSIDQERPDVLVLEGGLVALPAPADLGWHFGLPPGVALACMCEPMLLALEHRPDLASVDVDMPQSLVRTLRDYAATHGFRAGPARSFGHGVTSERRRLVKLAGRGGVGASLSSSGPET